MSTEKGKRLYRVTKRVDFLLVVAVYQVCLAIRYLDVEAYLVANNKVFSWTHFLEPAHVSFVLFLPAIFAGVVVITGRGARLAFATSMLAFTLLAILWLGAMLIGGYFEAWPTAAMYACFAWIVWLSAGIIDPPKKADRNG